MSVNVNSFEKSSAVFEDAVLKVNETMTSDTWMIPCFKVSESELTKILIYIPLVIYRN